MNEYYAINAFFASNPLIMYFLLAWSLFWKGLALWKSSQRQEKIWFIVLLVLNTMGLLEILYLFIFSKYIKASKKQEEKPEIQKNS